MSDNGNGQGQESAGATQGQGQESTQGSRQGQGQESAQQQGQQDQGQGGQFSLDSITDPAIRAYVEAQQREAAEARREAGRYRTERNTFQQQVQTFQQQNETDQERQQREAQEAQERVERLERENRDLRVNGALTAAAATAKAHNPATVTAMLSAKVTLDDDGNPTNLQDLIRDLRQSDPYLFKATDNGAGEGAGQQSGGTTSMNDVIRAQARARRGA